MIKMNMNLPEGWEWSYIFHHKGVYYLCAIKRLRSFRSFNDYICTLCKEVFVRSKSLEKGYRSLLKKIKRGQFKERYIYL